MPSHPIRCASGWTPLIRKPVLRARASLWIAIWGVAALASSEAQVVISQIYGGGGNTGALFRNDFVELFNGGTNTTDLAGWSVQYASAAGTTWQGAPLSGALPPGHYFLLQLASGGTNGKRK